MGAAVQGQGPGALALGDGLDHAELIGGILAHDRQVAVAAGGERQREFGIKGGRIGAGTDPMPSRLAAMLHHV